MSQNTSWSLDLGELLRTLLRHKVRFVVIGGVAGSLHGSDTATADLDVVYDRERDNIRRLAIALNVIEARRRDLPRDVSAAVDERAILNGMNFLLMTRFGPLDLFGETPSGRLTYAKLAVEAVRFEIGGEVVVSVASMDELIRMKTATGRERDRIEAERLMRLRDEHELREPAGPYRRPRKGRPRKAARARGSTAGRAASGRDTGPRSPPRSRSSRTRSRSS
jgi:hypothetical protein